MRFKTALLLLIGIFLTGGFFVVEYEIQSSKGEHLALETIEIRKGENVLTVGAHLQDVGIVSWRGWFAFYVWKEDLRHKIVAGKYQLSGAMTIPEIAKKVTEGAVVPDAATVTFPEGWDSVKMTARLSANALPGDDFLSVVRQPDPKWREEFWFLRDLPQNATLDGFLFPDTYTFSFNASARDIAHAMLMNFSKKFSEERKSRLDRSGKTIFETVTLASIVENEVPGDADRKMVADIFWRRLAIDQPLQSDATVKYIRGENKLQHSFEETRVDSPYNTYVYAGLPPGPIGNPGISSLEAVLFPTPNDFFYFLNDAATKETIFSVSFEEHLRKKAQHGL